MVQGKRQVQSYPNRPDGSHGYPHLWTICATTAFDRRTPGPDLTRKSGNSSAAEKKAIERPPHRRPQTSPVRQVPGRGTGRVLDQSRWCHVVWRFQLRCAVSELAPGGPAFMKSEDFTHTMIRETVCAPCMRAKPSEASISRYLYRSFSCVGCGAELRLCAGR